MKEKILRLCLLLIFLMLLTGCAGRIKEEEYDAMLDYIVENANIKDIEKQGLDGAGEGEKITYFFSGSVEGEERKFELKEMMNKDTFRVYEVSDVTDDKCVEILEIRLNDDGTTEAYYSMNGYGEKNQTFLMEQLGIDENIAQCIAYHLQRTESGYIVQYEDLTEEEHAFRVALINEDGDKYIASFDEDGNIESIMDEDGNCLYKSVD